MEAIARLEATAISFLLLFGLFFVTTFATEARVEEATRNKCIASSNKCLTSSNKKLRN